MNLHIGIASLITFGIIFLLIRFFTKTIIKIVLIGLVLAVLGIYAFIVIDNPEEDISFVQVMTDYTLDDLERLYCKNGTSKTDAIKCKCIITPLSNDMKSRFSSHELKHIKNNRIRYIFELIKSFRNQKSKIKQKLKSNNASHLLKNFGKDINITALKRKE